MMTPTIVVIGLPESGKTTFLAALWHLVSAREIETRLLFEKLGKGNATYLNGIAARWREAKVQDRTHVSGNQIVAMNLKHSSSGKAVEIVFPDVPGESYRQMWEDRECEHEVADTLRGRSVLLFIHADTITAPKWVEEEASLLKKLGIPVVEGQPVKWHPRLAPTQVQVVDLLQLLSLAPLDVGRRKLGIVLSAWDKARGEGLSPEGYLQAKLPLLNQYLMNNQKRWAYRIYGLSAQGGDYDGVEPGSPRKEEAAVLRRLDKPSERICLVSEQLETHDLTEPVAWLME